MNARTVVASFSFAISRRVGSLVAGKCEASLAGN
jgi:hypothetical protein